MEYNKKKLKELDQFLDQKFGKQDTSFANKVGPPANEIPSSPPMTETDQTPNERDRIFKPRGPPLNSFPEDFNGAELRRKVKAFMRRHIVDAVDRCIAYPSFTIPKSWDGLLQELIQELANVKPPIILERGQEVSCEEAMTWAFLGQVKVIPLFYHLQSALNPFQPEDLVQMDVSALKSMVNSSLMLTGMSKQFNHPNEMEVMYRVKF